MEGINNFNIIFLYFTIVVPPAKCYYVNDIKEDSMHRIWKTLEIGDKCMERFSRKLCKKNATQKI